MWLGFLVGLVALVLVLMAMWAIGGSGEDNKMNMACVLAAGIIVVMLASPFLDAYVTEPDFVGKVRSIELQSRWDEVGTVITLVDGTIIDIKGDWTDKIEAGGTYEFWVGGIHIVRLVEVGT